MNWWREDAQLREALGDRVDAGEMSRAGEAAGGPIAALVEAAHRDERLPRLVRYDRWGARVDRVEYCPEQVEARRLAMGLGVLPPAPLHERFAKAVLLNFNGEGGITCPLVMTDGLIGLVEAHGTAEQRRRWLPLARDPSVDTPLTCGQFVTERQGGSNVSENECAAAPAPDGTWRLMGLKWFCSNPGELWVTTAKPAGSRSVALFLVPRLRPDGTLNDAHILRLKDLSGTRGKATAEVEYRGAYAEMIGRPSRGLALLLDVVLKASRIGVAAAGLGFMGRARLEAERYAAERVVLGRRAADLPHIKQELGLMARQRAAALRAFVLMLDAVRDGTPAEDVLVPLLKVCVSKLGTEHVRRARLVLAGNATLRDFSPLPRLAEDALIQEIWEGTHPILAAHAEKALRRGASREAFMALLSPGARRELSERLAAHQALGDEARAAARESLCDAAYAALGAG